MKYYLQVLIILFVFGFTSLAHAESKVCFSPNGGCQDIIIAEINKAHKTIDVAMYSFTSKEIAQALIDAKKRDVKIRLTLDSAQIKDHFSKSRYLITKGLNLRFHMGLGIMHNKFAVIDDKEVLTGSYNWTITADKKNAENLLVITDKDLALKYAKQFKHLWGQSGEGGFKETQPSE